MSAKKPFTKRERSSWSDTRFGHRARNEWGAGDLPAPFAEGDVVRQIAPVRDNRLRGVRGREFNGGTYFVVVYGPSIEEGDGWYFRVTGGEPVRDALTRRRVDTASSDRLHVFCGSRSEYGESVDYMAAFELVETADPGGLLLRRQMLLDGWSYTPQQRCESCGQQLPRGAS